MMLVSFSLLSSSETRTSVKYYIAGVRERGIIPQFWKKNWMETNSLNLHLERNPRTIFSSRAAGKTESVYWGIVESKF